MKGGGWYNDLYSGASNKKKDDSASGDGKDSKEKDKSESGSESGKSEKSESKSPKKSPKDSPKGKKSQSAA